MKLPFKVHLTEMHGVIYFLPYVCYQEVTFGQTWCHSLCIGWWQLGLAVEWGMQKRDFGPASDK